MDDVIVFSKRFDNHITDLREVFLRVRNARLKLKPSKCSLFRDEVLYLGKLVNSRSISPNPAKLRVLATWPVPDTVFGVQSFLGFVNFYGDYWVVDRTDCTLYELTAGRKGTDRVQLNEQQRASFEELKRRLCAVSSARSP